MNFLSLLRRVSRKLEILCLPYFYLIKTNLSFLFVYKFKIHPHGLPADLVISLTSYPPRFKTLHLTLKCLFLQNTRVDKIVLWLAYDDYDTLPDKVLRMQDYGLLIMKTEDIKSYKKIIPTLKTYPNAYIVTVDDDLYYPSNLIENLLKKYEQHSGQVIASRTHVMHYDENYNLKPYSSWKKRGYDRINLSRNFFTSGAGTLFPPTVFHKDVLNSSIFLKLCPNADDIWLNWLVKLNGVQIIHSCKPFRLVAWPFSQKVALYKQNASINNLNNDEQIARMIQNYGLPK